MEGVSARTLCTCSLSTDSCNLMIAVCIAVWFGAFSAPCIVFLKISVASIRTFARAAATMHYREQDTPLSVSA